MKQLTPDEQKDLDRVKAMMYKNIKLMLEWTDLSEEEQDKKGREYIKGLITRTEMLVRSVKALEEMK